jgi:thioesterase domain-containing protein
MEQNDMRVAGTVLIDTYPTETTAAIMPQVLQGMFQRADQYGEISDRRIVAMMTYAQLMNDWGPGTTRAPVLRLRATDPMPGMTAKEDQWEPSWISEYDELQVPGDHFTMMEEGFVSASAIAVETWIGDRVQK